MTVHGPGFFAGGDAWRKSRLWGWLVHQRYKLQWEEHKDRGEEHRCTLTLQQKMLLINWCVRPIPEFNVVVSMVKMFALHKYFLALVYSRIASTMMEEK